MGDELLWTGNQGTRWRWETLNGRTLESRLLSLANLVKFDYPLKPQIQKAEHKSGLGKTKNSTPGRKEESTSKVEIKWRGK